MFANSGPLWLKNQELRHWLVEIIPSFNFHWISFFLSLFSPPNSHLFLSSIYSSNAFPLTFPFKGYGKSRTITNIYCGKVFHHLAAFVSLECVLNCEAVKLAKQRLSEEFTLIVLHSMLQGNYSFFMEMEYIMPVVVWVRKMNTWKNNKWLLWIIHTERY